MKSFKKGLMMLGCAALLVSASVMGTMAYLTDNDTVTNTFTVGKVSIKLDEAQIGDNGKALTGDEAKRVGSNEYHLLPGHQYDKDPTVTVEKGSESSYIKMVVTVNKAAELDKIFADHNLKLTDVVTDYDGENWLLQGKGGEKDADGNRTYTFWYKETVAAPDADVALDALFDQIKVPGELTGAEMETLQYRITKNDDGTTTKTEEKLTITVKAYAIQADGFDTAEKAWDAFDKQNTNA